MGNRLKNIKTLTILLFPLLLHASSPDRAQKFFLDHYEAAEQLYFCDGIPIQLSLGVWALESGYGTSTAAQRNNLAGIASYKGGKHWKRFETKAEFYRAFAAIFQQPCYSNDLRPKTVEQYLEAMEWACCSYHRSREYTHKIKWIIKRYKLDKMKKPRTDFDWNQHTHRVELFKSEEGTIRVDHLQIERNRGLYVKFTNTSDHLTITGDFGNYIFCRPFIPSEEGSVSEHYWKEKLEIGSIQNFERNDYDFDEIIKELKERLETIEEDYSDEDDQEEVIEYIDALIAAANENDKLEYDYVAYRSSKPDFIDYDFAPEYKKKNVRLQIVFDAFEEICRRIKEDN